MDWDLIDRFLKEEEDTLSKQEGRCGICGTNMTPAVVETDVVCSSCGFVLCSDPDTAEAIDPMFPGS